MNDYPIVGPIENNIQCICMGFPENTVTFNYPLYNVLRTPDQNNFQITSLLNGDVVNASAIITVIYTTNGVQFSTSFGIYTAPFDGGENRNILSYDATGEIFTFEAKDNVKSWGNVLLTGVSYQLKNLSGQIVYGKIREDGGPVQGYVSSYRFVPIQNLYQYASDTNTYICSLPQVFSADQIIYLENLYQITGITGLNGYYFSNVNDCLEENRYQYCPLGDTCGGGNINYKCPCTTSTGTDCSLVPRRFFYIPIGGRQYTCTGPTTTYFPPLWEWAVVVGGVVLILVIFIIYIVINTRGTTKKKKKINENITRQARRLRGFAPREISYERLGDKPQGSVFTPISYDESYFDI